MTTIGFTLEPKELQFFARMGVPAPLPEYKFQLNRDWRFDYAWPESKLALEVEGGVFTGGRHTSSTGFYKDMEKYNAAACLGWRVLRVTPKFLVTPGTVQLIKTAMAA